MTANTSLVPKRPAEVRQYVLDLSKELGDDTIGAFTFTVTSGAVTVNQKDNDDTTVTVLLGGGTDGATSQLELQVTTAAAQVLIRDYSLLTTNSTGAGTPSTSTKGQIMQMALGQIGLSGIGYTTLTTTTTTKGTLVNMAFEEITLAGYEFDATVDEQTSALRRLDALMRQWGSPGMNLAIGYNFPATLGASAMNDASGIPDIVADAVVCELAISIAPVIGKTLAAETQARIKSGRAAARMTYAVNLRELDGMMAQWASPGMNLALGYNFPVQIGGSADADASGIPDFALDAVALSLAMALPIPEKQITPEFRARLAQAMVALRATLAAIPEMSLPLSAARGAGAKPTSTWWPYQGSAISGG